MTVLRTVLLIVGGVALGAALLTLVAGAPFPVVMWLTILGAMLIGGILFERGRYKPPETGHPGAGWVDTGERFVDPDSGKEVTVYYQPASGERRYVGR